MALETDQDLMLEFLSKSKLKELTELTLKHIDEYEELRELLLEEKEFFTHFLIETEKEYKGKYGLKEEQ